MSPPSELEPTADQMRRLLEAAAERVVAHISSLPRQPATYDSFPAELARELSAAMPESGRPAEELLTLLFERAVPASFNTASPGYLAYIPGGGLFAAALADLLALSVNRYTGIWIAAPGLVQLETSVIRFFCDLVGYGPGSGGILTSGGSLANFSALVAARRDRLPENFLDGTLYVSSEAHHSVRKAAMLAGFPDRAVREVPVDDRFRVRLDALREAVAGDRARGLKPFLAVANAGSTNTGAVDDIEALADLAEAEGLWLHVDAAYGGFFLLTEKGRAALAGIRRADSVVLDPHKGLFLPYGNGALVVRNTAALKRAHSVEADYLPPLQDGQDRVDFSEISPELSRDFRGLRVWLPLMLHGVGAFRRALDEKLELAAWATEELRGIPGVEIVAPPQLSLVVFRLQVPGRDAAALDTLNQELLARVNARQRVHLSGTRVGGRFVLRICVLSFRTHRESVQHALDDIRAVASELVP